MNWVSTVPARNCWLLSTFCRKGMLVCKTKAEGSLCSRGREETTLEHCCSKSHHQSGNPWSCQGLDAHPPPLLTQNICQCHPSWVYKLKSNTSPMA